MARKPKLLDMIKSAKGYTEKQHQRWSNNIKLYKGEITKFRNKILPTWAHAIETNLTKPIVDAMLPNLIYRTPKINFRPGREIVPVEVQQQALTIENDINAIQVELRLDQEYKRATKDALILGDGFIKYGLTTDSDSDIDDYAFPAPYIKRASPWDVGIDPGCRESNLDDAEYIYFRNLIPLWRAQRSNKFKNKEKLKGVAISQFLPQHLQENEGSRKNTESFEYCALYELWVRENNMVYILDDEGTIFDEFPWPYDLEGKFPLVHISFNHVPDEFYCMGEPEHLETLQLEASEKRTQQLNHTRRFNRKYRVSPDMAKDDKEKLTMGDDGTVVTSREPVDVIADAPLQADILSEIGMVMSEAKEVSCVSAYQRGGSEPGVYTATEANMIGQAHNIRVEERRQEVADAISTGARILYNVMKEYKGWPPIPFQFTVDISTMRRPDDTEKRSDLMQFGQVAIQMPEFKRVDWLRDVALAFNKPPEQYVLTAEEVAQMQQQQPPDPAVMKAQADIQAKQQEMQLTMAMKQQEMQMKQEEMRLQLEVKKAEAEIEMQMMQAKLAMEQQKLGLEREKMAMQREQQQFNIQAQRASAMMNVQSQKEMNDAKLQSQMQGMRKNNAGTKKAGKQE